MYWLFLPVVLLIATIHTVVARGAGVRFHDSSADPLCVEKPHEKPGYRGGVFGM